MENNTFLEKLLAWFRNNKFFAVIIMIGIIIIAVANVFDSAHSIFENSKKIFPPAADTTNMAVIVEEKNSAFSKIVLQFGSKGIGPGKFTDARSIGVDADGRIYVGEYEDGGRIQVFDSTGKFISQWNIFDKSSLLYRMTSDRQGNIYANHKGEGIFKYEGLTGKSLGKLEYGGNHEDFDDLKSTVDGGLIASIDVYLGDDIIRFDSKGKEVKRIVSAIKSQIGDDAHDNLVAIDGLGNIYCIEDFGGTVFKYSKEGKFLTRFGTSGDQPGQIENAMAIAIDGNGRVYVSDFGAIEVFDSDGIYLTKIEIGASAYGLTFNDNNELFIAAGDRVVKLKII